MPTPARTSLERIVAAARGILEADGLAGLTMQRVAGAVQSPEPPSSSPVSSPLWALGPQAASAAREILTRASTAAPLEAGAHRRDRITSWTPG